MGSIKNNTNFVAIKDSKFFDLPKTEVATKEEMETYILNMNAPVIHEEGRNLVIEFDPFPARYVNYVRQRQYKGMRTQVFWQLVKYDGRKNERRWNYTRPDYEVQAPWRLNPDSDLYQWTFPIRRRSGLPNALPFTPYETEAPFIFTLTPKEATKGRILWKEGAATVRYFFRRPWGEKRMPYYIPREIAIIIGVANKGMKEEFAYKKSQSFLYDHSNLGPPDPTVIHQDEDEDEIAGYIYKTNVILEKIGNDIFVSFENLDEKLKNYAEENKENWNTCIFIQTFAYKGGTSRGDGRNKDREFNPFIKKNRSPAKTREHRKRLSREDLENGFFLGDQTYITSGRHPGPEVEKSFLDLPAFRGNLKHEEATFYLFSVALVLANPGMSRGFQIYKESNKIDRR